MNMEKNHSKRSILIIVLLAAVLLLVGCSQSTDKTIPPSASILPANDAKTPDTTTTPPTTAPDATQATEPPTTAPDVTQATESSTATNGAVRDTFAVFESFTVGFWSDDLKEFDIKGCLEANDMTVTYFSEGDGWNMFAVYTKYDRKIECLVEAFPGTCSFSVEVDDDSDNTIAFQYNYFDEADTDVLLSSGDSRPRISEYALAAILQYMLGI